MIKRDNYIKQIARSIDTEFIKVITGVRRSGKSYLLMMTREILIERGVLKENIHYINFEDPEYYDLLEWKALYNYLKERAVENEKNYFLFDEIQEVEGWQRLVNGLRVAFDSDIYITGSNASLLSGELATYLTGRYIEIKMMPLSFQEYKLFYAHQSDSDEKIFKNYFEYGGFPSVALQEDVSLKRDVLDGIYNSILQRDVAYRKQIRQPELLNRIAIYLLDNVGQLLSINKLTNTLKSQGYKVSNNTVEEYLNALEDAFLVYKAQRYDIRGKEYLKGQAKYYCVDLGFILSQLRKINSNRGSRIENLVYLELKRRGYDVFVGQYDGKEIDFVAGKHGEWLYVQVTEQLPEQSTRETDNLLHLPTGHKKIVITNSWYDTGEIDGIPIIHLLDFLNEEL